MLKIFGTGRFKTYHTDILVYITIGGNIYKGKKIATGQLTQNGFVLLKDSLVKKNDTIQGNPGVRGTKLEIKGMGLFDNYNPEYYKLNEDILLPSPSYAARLVHGNDRSGQKDWVNFQGDCLSTFVKSCV